MRALGKPWPTKVNTLGLMIDHKTPAPTIYIDTSEDSASPSPTIRPSKPRSLSDYGITSPSGRRERSSAPRPYGRPTIQRSHTEPSPPKQRGHAIPDTLNRHRIQISSDPLSSKVFIRHIIHLISRCAHFLLELFLSRRTSELGSGCPLLQCTRYLNIAMQSSHSSIPGLIPSRRNRTSHLISREVTIAGITLLQHHLQPASAVYLMFLPLILLEATSTLHFMSINSG